MGGPLLNSNNNNNHLNIYNLVNKNDSNCSNLPPQRAFIETRALSLLNWTELSSSCEIIREVLVRTPNDKYYLIYIFIFTICVFLSSFVFFLYAVVSCCVSKMFFVVMLFN